MRRNLASFHVCVTANADVRNNSNTKNNKIWIDQKISRYPRNAPPGYVNILLPFKNYARVMFLDIKTAQDDKIVWRALQAEAIKKID